MANFDSLIDDLVAANRILASEGIVDAFGHVSVRHPDHPGRFLLSRARSPELVERSDIMEFTLDGVATAGFQASHTSNDSFTVRFIKCGPMFSLLCTATAMAPSLLV